MPWSDLLKTILEKTSLAEVCFCIVLAFILVWKFAPLPILNSYYVFTFCLCYVLLCICKHIYLSLKHKAVIKKERELEKITFNNFQDERKKIIRSKLKAMTPEDQVLLRTIYDLPSDPEFENVRIFHDTESSSKPTLTNEKSGVRYISATQVMSQIMQLNSHIIHLRDNYALSDEHGPWFKHKFFNGQKGLRIEIDPLLYQCLKEMYNSFPTGK